MDSKIKMHEPGLYLSFHEDHAPIFFTLPATRAAPNLDLNQSQKWHVLQRLSFHVDHALIFFKLPAPRAAPNLDLNQSQKVARPATA